VDIFPFMILGYGSDSRQNGPLALGSLPHGGEGWFAFCHLRALSRSEKGQWEAFWNRDFSCN
jgi:hypothetical protein